MSLKILTFHSDVGGCNTYRVRNPNIELRRFGVESVEYAFIPNNPFENQMQTLVNAIEPFDLVILQRCYLPHIFKMVRDATEFLGIPLIFETDDDYLHLEKENPAYWSVIPRGVLTKDTTQAEAEKIRSQYQEAYKVMMSECDLITTSTEELKNTLYPYNKNIKVLPNNVLNVFYHRTWDAEHNFIGEDGKYYFPNHLGMISTPSFFVDKNSGQYMATPRIGYTCTPSHAGSDWQTVEYYWNKLIQRWSKNCWFIYIGAYPSADGTFGKDYWISRHNDVCQKYKLPRKVIPIEPSQYEFYMYHIRNVDIGIAPLAPNVFNMSKSEIKWLEYSAWGIPAVLPNYVTYNRSAINNETALLYDNGKEFQEAVETLIRDSNLRLKIGSNARKWVEENRLERHWAKERFDTYQNLINNGYRLRFFDPVKEVKDAA